MAVMRWGIRGAGRCDLGIVVMILLGVMIAACTETVLDENSARVIRRGIDTVVRYDTTRLFDTVIVADTLFTIDTVIRYDTVIVERIVIRIDTVFQSDTLRLRDTTRLFDTLTVRDTIVRYDTIRDSQGQFSVQGWLYKRSSLTGMVLDSLPLLVDPASVLGLELGANKVPIGLELRLIARIPKPLYLYNWGEYSLSMIYLLVGHMDVPPDGSVAQKGLINDPRLGPSGIAAIPYQDAQWLATGGSGSEGIFRIDRNIPSERIINASFRAYFNYQDGVEIDSATMIIRY